MEKRRFLPLVECLACHEHRSRPAAPWQTEIPRKWQERAQFRKFRSQTTDRLEINSLRNSFKKFGIRRTWNKFNSFSTEFVGPLILSINWRINQTAGQMEKWPANPSHNEYLSRSTRWASARRITRIHQFPRDRLHWCDSQIALTADAISEEITKWNLSL